MIEAYELAEQQNWIGFVLSEKTKERLENFESDGRTIWDIYQRYYPRYDVPCKKGKCSLPVYSLSLRDNYGENEKAKEAVYLWNSLIFMQKKAKQYIDATAKNSQKWIQYRKIMRKHKNTKYFLLKVFPVLRTLVRNKTKHISQRTLQKYLEQDTRVV